MNEFIREQSFSVLLHVLGLFRNFSSNEVISQVGLAFEEFSFSSARYFRLHLCRIAARIQLGRGVSKRATKLRAKKNDTWIN